MIISDTIFAEALGKIGDRRGFPYLESAVTSEDPDTSYRAAVAVGILGDNACVDMLTKHLMYGTFAQRKGAAEALENLDWNPSEPLLQTLFFSYKERVPPKQSVTPDLIQNLLDVVDDDKASIEFRILAAQTLSQIEEPSALDSILKVARGSTVFAVAAPLYEAAKRISSSYHLPTEDRNRTLYRATIKKEYGTKSSPVWDGDGDPVYSGQGRITGYEWVTDYSSWNWVTEAEPIRYWEDEFTKLQSRCDSEKLSLRMIRMLLGNPSAGDLSAKP